LIPGRGMRLVVATFGPRVPYVTTRDGMDQGPAGSLEAMRGHNWG
jgi:hypothetical protein